MRRQHITILHSNDIHSDYTHKKKDGSKRERGGIAYLAGYIEKKREEAPLSTLYAFAGDMFNGSLMDSLSNGYESVNIMNMIKPNVATVGNHELDYQLACLSYYKDRCEFPLICANMYDKFNQELFFDPTHIQPVGDMNILFIGLVTDEIKKRGSKDLMVKLQMDCLKPVDCVVKCYQEKIKDTRVDMTVILSHLGLEEDKKLAEALAERQDCKVDLIIGGHSHDIEDGKNPEYKIPIVQAGTGTEQIGRCEIEFDLDEKRIVDFDWSCDPIICDEITPNLKIKKFVDDIEKSIDRQYKKTLTTLKAEKTLADGSKEQVLANAEHSSRYKGTEVGNLICDALAAHFDLDIVLIGSGSLRKNEMESNVTRAEVMEMYSYADEKLYAIWLNGKELKTAMNYYLGQAPVYVPNDPNDHHMEFFQISHGFYFEYDSSLEDKDGYKLVKATYEGEDIADDEWFKVGIEGYHMNYMADHLGLDNASDILTREHEGLTKKKKSGSIQYSIKDYMRGKKMLEVLSEVRILKK